MSKNDTFNADDLQNEYMAALGNIDTVVQTILSQESSRTKLMESYSDAKAKAENDLSDAKSEVTDLKNQVTDLKQQLADEKNANRILGKDLVEMQSLLSIIADSDPEIKKLING